MAKWLNDSTEDDAEQSTRQLTCYFFLQALQEPYKDKE